MIELALTAEQWAIVIASLRYAGREFRDLPGAPQKSVEAIADTVSEICRQLQIVE